MVIHSSFFALVLLCTQCEHFRHFKFVNENFNNFWKWPMTKLLLLSTELLKKNNKKIFDGNGKHKNHIQRGKVWMWCFGFVSINSRWALELNWTLKLLIIKHFNFLPVRLFFSNRKTRTHLWTISDDDVAYITEWQGDRGQFVLWLKKISD